MYRYLCGRIILSKKLLVEFYVLTMSVPTAGSSKSFGAPRYFALELEVLSDCIVL